MYHYVFAGLTLLLITLVNMPVIQAEPTAASGASTRNSSSPTRKLTPFTLVYLAYQGHYRNQKIRGYSGLFADSREGRINARKLVQAAVNAGELPAETLDNQKFINAVEANLESIRIPNSP